MTSIAVGLGDRGEHRLAPQRPLGVLLRVVDQVVAILALHPRVGLRVDPARAELALDPLPHLVRAGVDELVRDLELGVRGDRVDGGLAELGLGALLEALRAGVRRSSSRSSAIVSNSEASAAKSSSSSGRSFSRTSLTLSAKLAVLPARSSGW